MDNKLIKLQGENFGEYIKRIRELRGYSQRQLADRINLSNTTISRIEKDSSYKSDANTVIKLAEGLNLSKEEMLIAAGYLDKKKELTQLDSIKDYIKLGLKNLGWVNSYNHINEETLDFVEFILKKYGNKYGNK